MMGGRHEMKELQGFACSFIPVCLVPLGFSWVWLAKELWWDLKCLKITWYC